MDKATEKYQIMVENRLIYISRLIKQIPKEISVSVLEKLPEEFFQVLFGLFSAVKLKLSLAQIEQLQLIILYLRLTGGANILLTQYENDYYFINLDNAFGLFSNKVFSYDDKEEVIEKAIKNTEIYLPEITELFKDKFFSLLKENKKLVKGKLKLVIITHNNPEILKARVEGYIGNFLQFNHKNIKIIIFDSSDEAFAKKSKAVVEQLKKKYAEITYLDNNFRNKFINELIQKSKEAFPELSTDKFEFYIPYVFGRNDFYPTYGRNFNFISQFLKDDPFILVDESCKPKVLTYETGILKKAIKQMISKNILDLKNLGSYISKEEENKTQFLPVDFISYFKNSNINAPQYVRYSGQKGLNKYYHLIRELGFDLGNKKIFAGLTDNLNSLETESFIRSINTEAFVYAEKKNNASVIRDLCRYFPEFSSRLRVTVPENIRIDDSILGLNYTHFSNVIPIETNFALYSTPPEKDKVTTVEDIYNDFFSQFFHFTYYSLIRELEGIMPKRVSKLVNYFEAIDLIEIPPLIFENAYKYSAQCIKVFENCLKIAHEKKDTKTIKKIEKANKAFKHQLFSVNKDEYEKKVTSIVTNIFRHYSSCLLASELVNATLSKK